MISNRLIVPILLLIASVGMFFGFISPQFKEKALLQAEVLEYKDSLEKAEQLNAKQEELDKKNQSIGTEDQADLKRILPDNVDTIKMIMDINGIASKYGILVKSIKINTPKDKVQAITVGPDGQVIKPKQLDYDSLSLTFNLTTTYNKFEPFLEDLEESLRIIDVTSASLKSLESATSYDFSVTAKTYWLK